MLVIGFIVACIAATYVKIVVLKDFIVIESSDSEE